MRLVITMSNTNQFGLAIAKQFTDRSSAVAIDEILFHQVEVFLIGLRSAV
jgi:hypothetical protein